MTRSSGRQTRILAAVAVVMVVTAAQPLLGTVGADGQLKLLHVNEANEFSVPASLTQSNSSDRELCPKRLGCEGVPLIAMCASAEEDDSDEKLTATPNALGTNHLVPTRLRLGVLKQRQAQLTPPSLIVTLCHFTC